MPKKYVSLCARDALADRRHWIKRKMLNVKLDDQVQSKNLIRFQNREVGSAGASLDTCPDCIAIALCWSSFSFKSTVIDSVWFL